MRRILIIEDEAPIREMVKYSLELAQFEVLEAENGAQGLQVIAAQRPALVLLDWMLPDQPGLNVLKTLRQNPQLLHTPVIMLTALAEEENKIRGLKTGADDYVVKPFSPMELIARIDAVLRRSQPQTKVQCGKLVIHTDTQQITLAGKVLKLTALEYKLLSFLAAHPNQVFNREQLLTKVWPEQVVVTDRSIDVYILRLRKFLAVADCGHYIQTERGRGYRFNAEPDHG